ncbi:protein kinase [Amycolatopsis acidicola]|uniref:non-specific serine/threonine protein kinase n=1 Tax=Amycolatopsis acidicola TaxID=2596893 RepID=A0A5N0UT77_9PSEU|nr:protein kinase [Amycolatopsis acidicola]KAA9155012.1 protein kinase [Amycolatopsis acidicola]
MTDEGELIAGRYRVVSRIGRGSMGVVWQARDERLDRVVAVKELVLAAGIDQAEAEQAVRRAVREGKVAARLRHPHAITVHDVVEHAGKPCLIMEFLPSQSLAALIAERGTLSAEYVADVGSQIASALAAAHAEGIVHRDVTPGNVLIGEDGTAKLADFGIARAFGDATVTDGGVIAGTPAFLAPEVAGGAEASFASDVFSLGATLYNALEGAPPFGTSENPYALLQRVAGGEIVPPRQTGPLVDVLGRMLRRDPAERPAADEARELLSAVAQGKPVPPPHNPTLLLQPRRRPSRRAVVIGSGAVALVAVGVLIGSLLGGDGDGNPVAAPETTPPPTTTAPPACEATYEVTNSWPGAYQAQVTVRGESKQVTGWTVSWRVPAGHKVGNLWNGTLQQNGTSVTVSNAAYNAVLSPGATTTFGFIASTPDDQAAPPEVTCQSP